MKINLNVIILGVIEIFNFISSTASAVLKIFLITVVTIYLFESQIINVELVKRIVFNNNVIKINLATMLFIISILLVLIATLLRRIRVEFIHNWGWKLYTLATIYLLVGVFLISVKFGLTLLIGINLVYNVSLEVQRNRAQKDYNKQIDEVKKSLERQLYPEEMTSIINKVENKYYVSLKYHDTVRIDLKEEGNYDK